MVLNLISHTFVYGGASVFHPFHLNFARKVVLAGMRLFLLDTRKIERDGEFATWLENTISLGILFLTKILQAICRHYGDYQWTILYSLHPPYFPNRLMTIIYPP
jgi:hypothetical protein